MIETNKILKGNELMTVGRFEHIQQKGENDCGIACAAMVAGVSLKEATICSPNPKEEQWVSNICQIVKKCTNGNVKMNSYWEYRIPIHFESLEDFQTYLERLFEKMNDSLLIRSVCKVKRQGHFLLYDAIREKISDPWISQRSTIRKFAGEYFNKKYLEFYQMRSA